jgi:hypothetical protein
LKNVTPPSIPNTLTMKNKEHDSVKTVPIYSGKILQRGTPNTLGYNRSTLPPWYRHFTKKSGGVKLVLWAQTLAS